VVLFHFYVREWCCHWRLQTFFLRCLLIFPLAGVFVAEARKAWEPHGNPLSSRCGCRIRGASWSAHDVQIVLAQALAAVHRWWGGSEPHWRSPNMTLYRAMKDQGWIFVLYPCAGLLVTYTITLSIFPGFLAEDVKVCLHGACAHVSSAACALFCFTRVLRLLIKTPYFHIMQATVKICVQCGHRVPDWETGTPSFW